MDASQATLAKACRLCEAQSVCLPTSSPALVHHHFRLVDIHNVGYSARRSSKMVWFYRNQDYVLDNIDNYIRVLSVNFPFSCTYFWILLTYPESIRTLFKRHRSSPIQSRSCTGPHPVSLDWGSKPTFASAEPKMIPKMLRCTSDLHRGYEPRNIIWPGVALCVVLVSNAAGVPMSLIEIFGLAVRAWLPNAEFELFDTALPLSQYAQLCDEVLPNSALFVTSFFR